MLCAWASSVNLLERTGPLVSASVFVLSLLCFRLDSWLSSFHGESDCSVMSIRSLASRDRAGKSVRSHRKGYDERVILKMEENLEEPCIGK